VLNGRYEIGTGDLTMKALV